MFCTHCGASFRADQRFCGVCGTSVAAPGPAVASPLAPAPVASAGLPPLGRVARHVRMLGILWIVLSAIHLLRGSGRLLGARMVGMVGRTWSDDVPWALTAR